MIYLKGVLVYVDVQASLDAFGFAEQHQVLKQEHMSLALLSPVPDGKLILPDQLALFLQVHLRQKTGMPQPSRHVYFVKRIIKTPMPEDFIMNTCPVFRQSDYFWNSDLGVCEM